MTFKMSELIIANAKKNGDLPKEQDYKFITLFDALKNTDVIKKYNEQFKKEFGRPSVFASQIKEPRSKAPSK
tara:strand:+ start:243 stop:458 length:216 start_codon:yes stop_codon:yes gene_type:complete